MGQTETAALIVEHEEGLYGGHPWQQARKAIVDLGAELAQREEVAAIVGSVGPKMSATSLHRTIWSAVADLWDHGHPRQAVQTAGQALEGLLQIHAGPGVSGQSLAALFSTKPPTATSPRLRIIGLDPESATFASAHEGASGLVRGSIMAIRNLVSHPGWPDPSDDEAFEMLATMSYLARLIDRCELLKA